MTTSRSARRLAPAGRADGIGARAWRVVLLNGLCHVGSGLTLPFLLVYLHVCRGIGLSTVGLVLAMIGLAGLLSTPLVGWLTDRYGAGPVLFAALMTAGAGTATFALATGPPVAFLAAAIFGTGAASMWSALFTLLASVVPEARYVRVFSFNNAAVNIGIGAGATLGGFFLGGTAPRPYQVMFVINAITFGFFAAMLALCGEVRSKDRPGPAAPEAPAGAVSAANGRDNWRGVASDRRLIMVTVLHTVLIIAVLSQFTAAFPAWATGQAHSSARVVGVAFALNTVLVVALQPIVIARIEKVARTTATAIASLLFACCWLVALTAPAGHGGLATGLILVTALVIAAFGEVLLAPSLSSLVNGLATDDLRGRYNAFFNIAWQVGPILGPAAAGLVIGHGMASLFLLGLAATCLIAAGYSMTLRRVVPPAANGITQPQAPDRVPEEPVNPP